ncbi:MAG: hypothetical protein GY795_18565, partial [Desulfobacterales bacterium]|nr:hypothetical protein [Desulfobacterales bacterium]
MDYTDDLSSGEWEISDDGLTVTQHINSAPTFFISDFNFIDSRFEGSFRVDTEEDDDFIGFIFGFQGLGEKLGYYLLSWKKESQINAEQGFKLLKVWGIPDDVTEIDISTEIGDGENSDHIAVLASHTGNGTGWLSYHDYSFHLTYRQDGNMRVIISDAQSSEILWNTGLVNDPEPLGSGKVGFFNNSQEGVTYSGFSKITMLPPVAVPGGPYVFSETTSNITLDATGSYDPDGEQSGFDAIVSLQWDIGNDGIADDHGRTNSVENITLEDVLAKGLTVGVDVTIKLTVVDTDGLENSTLGTIRYKSSDEVDLTEGLAAYYSFNGNANDESGNRNHGTVNGAVLTSDRFGEPNSAYSFDGDSNILVSDSASLDITDAISVTGWINPSSLSASWQTIITKGNEPHENYSVFLERTKSLHIANVIDGKRYYWNSDSLVTQTDNWYFFTVTYDGKTEKCYINGIYAGSKEISGTLTANDHNLQIGMRGNGTSFYGIIDDIRIYNRAISESEIQSLYQQGDGVIKNFTANKTSGNAPLTVEFNALSNGTPTSYAVG